MTSSETYTPGYSQNAINFMARRSAQSHAAFLLPHLRPGLRLLDCGCGPGSMTCDLAREVAPGSVVGLDRELSQVERARSYAANQGLDNVAFVQGGIYEIPFPDESFDVVFAHALFEHLSASDIALAEIRRVLVPSGLVALRSPDWGGLIIAPDSPGLQDAIQTYTRLQNGNGGDVYVGRKFKTFLRQTDFTTLCFSVSCEYNESASLVGQYLGGILETEGLQTAATAWRHWSTHQDALFALTWCEVVGIRNAT
ncbi:MAG: methyltransferase domain-containing protein [Scytonema sp. RU_4_4]|nr:methyltransferase domain-containing protein [Scytonema sp. RU_4_4]NJR73354.1 methyltransferase domain-containing protein [Scytonema sp. CRU_2_7]